MDDANTAGDIIPNNNFQKECMIKRKIYILNIKLIFSLIANEFLINSLSKDLIKNIIKKNKYGKREGNGDIDKTCNGKLSIKNIITRIHK